MCRSESVELKSCRYLVQELAQQDQSTCFARLLRLFPPHKSPEDTTRPIDISLSSRYSLNNDYHDHAVVVLYNHTGSRIYSARFFVVLPLLTPDFLLRIFLSQLSLYFSIPAYCNFYLHFKTRRVHSHEFLRSPPA